ncbi:PREDICTED: uncharacterized protein LOC106324320 [Brassica oleracea var. oleracea]|uniref:uncharacterized protein LOC106324320 n=1 Tax=Brassica oleracea var. oleracea TaxID=109376 RepID=UPI0006A7294B|nr:PREDICTED: uncharacterized protein LOC106324320 [Brassica oleracea var. oleracea]
MTNQRSRTKTRAKHKSKKSNLVTVDASKLSSHDQVPPRVKKRTTKAAIRTNPPTNDQAKVADNRPCANSKNDLRSIIEESKVKRVDDSSVQPQLKPRVVNLRDQLNSKSEDLRIKLNRPTHSDLRRKLKVTKAKNGDAHEPIVEDSSTDQRVHLQNRRVERSPFLNVIMGGTPPCGDSVRSVKDHRRHAVTSKKWPSKPENDPSITFSSDDAIGVHVPHNDPLLVEVGITKCDVAKVLVDTGSSVDLIFRDTVDKMGVDLRDMKPSSRSLTGFNGASETMIRMIKLPVYACGVTRTVKFSVIRTKAPYNAILGVTFNERNTIDVSSVREVPRTERSSVDTSW